MNDRKQFRNTTRSAAVALAMAAVLTGSPAVGADNACQGGERVRTVTQWGHPATTFSKTPATTLAELQSQFVLYERDFRRVLELAGWPGDPDDLFDAVRSGTAVTPRQVPADTVFEWMAFRKRGQPACVNSVMWKGAEPFPAWNIVVESGDYEYDFVVPKTCVNLSMEPGVARKVALPPPTCKASASFDRAANRVTVRVTSDSGAPALSSAKGPEGALDSTALAASGSGQWTLEPASDGRYDFNFAVKRAEDGQTSTCTANVAVERMRPNLVLAASAAPDSHLITIDSSGSVGEVSITGVTLPDGSTGDLGAVTPAGENLWRYDSASTLPAKPGDYDYTFDGLATLHGMEDRGSAVATVTREPRTGQWILRGFGGRIDGDGGPVESDLFGGVDSLTLAVPPSRTSVSAEGDEAFGLGLEYLFRPRIGVELEVLSGDLDGQFMVDTADGWEMGERDLGTDAVSLGVNFHLTPEKLVDIYVGAFASLVDVGSATYSALGRSLAIDGEDEVVLGFRLGSDIYFGWQSHWALSLGARYIPIDVEVRDVDLGETRELSVDPVVLTAGFAYRF